MPTPSELPPKVADFRYCNPLDSVWNGCAVRETVKFLAEPATLSLLIAVAWIEVLPVVPTTGSSNWNAAPTGPWVAEVMSKFWIAPLTTIWTLGVVIGVVGMVVAVLLATRLMIWFK